MRSAHLKKITDRVTRLIPMTNDTTLMRSMISHVLPRSRWQTVLNRVTDFQHIMLRDVPELITAVQELKQERTELRRQLLDLRQQLEASITEEDGVEVEREEPGIGDVLVELGYLD